MGNIFQIRYLREFNCIFNSMRMMNKLCLQYTQFRLKAIIRNLDQFKQIYSGQRESNPHRQLGRLGVIVDVNSLFLTSLIQNRTRNFGFIRLLYGIWKTIHLKNVSFHPTNTIPLNNFEYSNLVTEASKATHPRCSKYSRSSLNVYNNTIWSMLKTRVQRVQGG